MTQRTKEQKRPEDYRPKQVSPLRSDPPGAVKSMPHPTKLHHIHFFSDENYEEMVDFYQRLFDAEIVNRAEGVSGYLTFMTFDDHDHRVIIIKKPGWGAKPDRPVGISHVAFCYASLGEVLYIYEKMKAWGHRPHLCVNHGNSTAMYFKDPDGNQVEIMVDNFEPWLTKQYKKHYQFTAPFGKMDEGNFDPDKMLALYESGVPDDILLDREEVRKLVREGKL